MEEMGEKDEDEGWGEIQEWKMTNLIRKPSLISSLFILFADFYVKFISTYCCFSIKSATHSSGQGCSVNVVSAALPWVFKPVETFLLGPCTTLGGSRIFYICPATITQKNNTAPRRENKTARHVTSQHANLNDRFAIKFRKLENNFVGASIFNETWC